MIFCTLFDSNYLDKGLVMYRSLCDHVKEFKLYLLAIDQRCKEIIDAYRYENIYTIDVDSFAKEMDLSDIRETRSLGEFCWTCTSFLIDYVLTKCGENSCTYIDSDLCFYSDPTVLLNEMGEKTVQIVRHNFLNSPYGRIMQLNSGTYCVQFNTFVKEDKALELLHWWEERCRESCSNMSSTGVFGDQKYLEGWEKYKFVSILDNLGGGVAPWNVSNYLRTSKENYNNSIRFIEKNTGKEYELVFYHFHNLKYYDYTKVNIGVYEVWKADMELVHEIYIQYLERINKTKEELKNRFGFYPFIKIHPGLVRTKSKKSIKEWKYNLKNRPLDRLYIKTFFKIRQKKYASLNILEFGQHNPHKYDEKI